MQKLHTIDIISEIAGRNKSIKRFYLAAYRYVPQALLDRGRLKIYSIKTYPLSNLKKRIRTIRIPKKWELGLASRVKMVNGEYCHIPQIDFACPISKYKLEIIKKRLSRIVKIFPGYILKTSKSYHYISLRLLNQKAWQRFIGSCLLCNMAGGETVVDARWFGYSLRAGYTNLRIFATDSKYDPKVVMFLGK